MERKLVITEKEDGSIVMEGATELLQKAMETQRRTEPKSGIFSGMPSMGGGKGMPKMPEMGIGNPGKGKSGLPEMGLGLGNTNNGKPKMPEMGIDFNAMKGKSSSGFGNAPSVGKLEKPTKGFGDIVGKGSSLPEMPEVRMPESFGLDIRKGKKKTE